MLKRNFTVLRFALVLGLISTAAFAQSKPADPALPSEDTVNGFMKYTFGFDPGTTWKILKIQPSPYGMAEVNVHFSYPLLTRPNGRAALAMHVDDSECAASVLQGEGFRLLSQRDISR